jgi:hypothetical protein
MRNFKVEIEKADSSATSMPSYQNARCHVPEPQVSDIFTLLGPMCSFGSLFVLHPVVKRQAGRRDAKRKNDQTLQSVSETSTETE